MVTNGLHDFHAKMYSMNSGLNLWIPSPCRTRPLNSRTTTTLVLVELPMVDRHRDHQADTMSITEGEDTITVVTGFTSDNSRGGREEKDDKLDWKGKRRSHQSFDATNLRRKGSSFGPGSMIHCCCCYSTPTIKKCTMKRTVHLACRKHFSKADCCQRQRTITNITTMLQDSISSLEETNNCPRIAKLLAPPPTPLPLLLIILDGR